MLAQLFSRLSLVLLALSLCVRILTTPGQSNAQTIFPSEPTGPPSRILLLTAHPDDECMFFAPTITALTSTPAAEVSSAVQLPEFFSLCLSVGNADGLGEVRKGELSHSLDVLGIDQSHRWLTDILELPDNITVHWDADVIAKTIKPYVLENNIDTILTFDYEGISSHPNHKSLPHGVARLIQTLSSDRPAPLHAYGLITVPLVHKYIGPCAALLAKLDFTFSNLLQKLGPASAPGVPAFVSSIAQYRTALRAMRQHESQLVWFRWLYVASSRYMWVNEWVRIVPANDPPRTV